MAMGHEIPADLQILLSRIDELERELEAARDFAASASDWFWESDAEGRFSYLSPHFQTSFNEDPEPYIGKRRDEVVLRFEDETVAKAKLALIEQQRPFRDLHFQRRTANGELVWARTNGIPRFDHNGTFLGYRGAGSNVTELVTLSQRKSELVSLIDDAPFGVLVFDEQSRVKIANRRLRETLGSIYGGFRLGMHHRDVLQAAIEHGAIDPSPMDPTRWIDNRVSEVHSKPTVTERKHGDSWSEVRSEPLSNGSTLLYEVDVTERRRLQEQLRHQQRLESIGSLTAGVAHDFNNLLAVILGNLELIDRHGLPDKTREQIDTALAATLKGAGLTRQLLAFGRKSDLVPEVLDANNVVEEMMVLFRRTLPATVTLSKNLAPNLKLARIDRGQLEQALLNLVINASDAISGGGRITISTKRERLEPGYVGTTGAAVVPGCYILIEVADTGVGMDAKTAESAFDPFFTTKPVGEGSGLGLSMVIGFTQQSGGDARLSSAPGRGTTVSLYFPAEV